MPRLSYVLTRAYTPDYEAVSREIAVLRARSDAPVLGLWPLRSNPLHLREDGGVLGGHPLRLRLQPHSQRLLRESGLLHAFAPLPLPRRLSWLLRSSPAPRLLTVTALDMACVDVASLRRWPYIVLECERDRTQLLDLGVSADRLWLIPPCAAGVEMSTVPPMPAGNFTVLFASMPFEADEAQSRGVDILLEAARLQPDLRVLLLSRPGACTAQLESPLPPNVRVIDDVVTDLSPLYAEAHAVVAPFGEGSKSKSAPNSLIEGRAVGRPAIASEAVGIAHEVRELGLGVVYQGGAAELLSAIQRLRCDLERRSLAAHRYARASFSKAGFVERYESLYAALRGRTGTISRQDRGSATTR